MGADSHSKYNFTPTAMTWLKQLCSWALTAVTLDMNNQPACIKLKKQKEETEKNCVFTGSFMQMLLLIILLAGSEVYFDTWMTSARVMTMQSWLSPVCETIKI